jgi:hypothetical protein
MEPWLCQTSAFSLINRLGNWVVVVCIFSAELLLGKVKASRNRHQSHAAWRVPAPGRHL